MMRLRFLLLLWFASTSLALADWQVVRQTDESSSAPGLIDRHIEMADSTTGDRATLDLAIFATRDCALRVIDNPSGADLEAAVQSTRALAGANGGYFDPAFAPLGL